MDKATLELYIRAFASTDNEPPLNQQEIELLIESSKRSDKYGVGVTETGWLETYDLNYAISRAWEMKAGKAAGLYTFLQGGNQAIRSDMIRHCTQMSDRWRRGCYAAVNLGEYLRNPDALSVWGP